MKPNEWMGHSADPAFTPYLTKFIIKVSLNSLYDLVWGDAEEFHLASNPKFLDAMSGCSRRV